MGSVGFESRWVLKEAVEQLRDIIRRRIGKRSWLQRVFKTTFPISLPFSAHMRPGRAEMQGLVVPFFSQAGLKAGPP